MEEVLIALTRQTGYHNDVIAGYSAALDGVEFDYHSHHPSSGAALLCRARSGMHRLEWESAPLPDTCQTPEFVFLCAICGGKEGGRRFELQAESAPVAWFQTSAPGAEPFAIIETQPGVTLSFEPKLTDAHGDHHGLLRLRLPLRDDATPGRLRFALLAEEAESDDWFILFRHEFSPLPRLAWQPVLLHGENGPLQALQISYDDIFGPCAIHAGTPGNMRQFQSADGLLLDYLGIPASAEERLIRVLHHLDGNPAGETLLRVPPTIPRRVHILPFSHNDIGYTARQDEVLRRQQDNLDLALAEASRTADYPPEAQARWNLEILWPLERWWREAPPERKDTLLSAVRSGHIGLNALHNNLLSGLCSQAELRHHLDFAREFAAETGLSIETAAQTDIPGFVWALVAVLAEAGVRFLALAPNSGDRVGNIYKLADQPFFWESPDGQARVLTWIFGAGYALFHRETLDGTGLRKALNYLACLQEEDYPHPVLPLAYTIGGDNGPPDPTLPEFVRDWNARFASPSFVVSTHAAFYREFMEGNLAGLPVLRGDMTPHWEDGAASTAWETRLNRNAADRLLQTEALYQRFRPDDFPATALREAWGKVILFDEHTWGAWNSVSEPDAESVRAQWEFKQALALHSDRMSRELLDGFLRLESCPARVSFPCFSSLPFPNSGMLVLPEEAFPESTRFVEPSGLELPRQLLYNSRLAVWAEFPAGPARLHVTACSGTEPPAMDWEVESTTLANPWLRAELDPATCSLRSLIRTEDGAELLLPGEQLARYWYMRGTERDKLLGVGGGRVLHHANGEICAEALLAGDAPGCSGYSVLFRLFHAIPRLVIEIRLDKLAVREPESVHLAFPLAVPEGILRYDGAGTLIRPELDQLPVACRNFFCLEGLVDVSAQGKGICVAFVDNPLCEIGSITAELPWLQRCEPSTRFFAYLMNNYWHTNYKADQSGPAAFRFSLFLHDVLEDAEVLRYSRLAKETPVSALDAARVAAPD